MQGDGDSKRPSAPPPPARPSSPPPGNPRQSSNFPSATSPSGTMRIPSARSPRISTSAALRLSTIDYDLSNAARRVIESALGVVPGERVALLVDRARRDVGGALLDVARTLGADPNVPALEALEQRPMRQ